MGEPGQPGHIPSYKVEVEEGGNYTPLFQPGLTNDILQIAQLHAKQGTRCTIKPVQTPTCPTLAKVLDETIPMEKSHAALLLLRKKVAAKQAGQRHSDVHDSLDPFDEADDIEQNLNTSYHNLSDKEKGAYTVLQPIFGIHFRTLIGKLLYYHGLHVQTLRPLYRYCRDMYHAQAITPWRHSNTYVDTLRVTLDTG